MPQRIDDSDLGDDEVLWRRILDQPMLWFTKTDDGTLVASSAAFKDALNEVSVNVASQTTLADVLNDNDHHGVVSLEVKIPRELGQIVAKTLELDDPTDPSHRVICPPEGRSRKHRLRDAKAMALAARWEVFPASERAGFADRDSAADNK